MNAIYVRRRSMVTLPEGAGATPLNVVATVQKNLEGPSSSSWPRTWS